MNTTQDGIYLNFKYKLQGNGEASVKDDDKIDEEIKV